VKIINYKNIAEVKSHPERGVVELLFAAVAFGLFLFLIIFSVDSYLIAQGSYQLRAALEKACNESATDSVVSKRLDADGRFLSLLNARLVGSNLDLTRASLYVPGMPHDFNLQPTGGAFPAFPNANTATPEVSFNSGDFINNVNNFPTAPPDGFPAESYDGFYDAGSFVGCYAEANIRTMWWRPNGMERTVSAKFAFASGIRGVDPRVVNSNDDYPAIVVGIGPQIRTLPTSGIPALDGTNTYIFNSTFLNSGTHRNLDDTLIRISGSGPFLAWPRLTDSTSPDESDVRTGLYAACASAPVVLRQRATSALFELLSRHGVTRTSTSVLISNPYTGAAYGNGRPVEVVRAGEDLRDKSYRLPVLSAVHNNDSGYDPFLVKRDVSTIKAEYSSLLSRMSSFCYHIDTLASERLNRLRVASQYPLSFVTNPGYEGSSFDAYPDSGQNFIAAPPDYFDLLGYWSTPNGGQRLIDAPMMASLLGAQSKCPYTVDDGGSNFCSNTIPELEPDIVGIMNAWLSGPGTQTVHASPGFGALSTASFAVDNRRTSLVLFTHELTSAQWSQVGALLPALGGARGPVTIVYIPTTIPVGGGFETQVTDILNRLGPDRTKVCRPSFQNDASIESHVFLPIIPTDDGTGNTVTPSFPCLRDHFKCMAVSSTMEQLWDCLLSEDETSIDNLIKEQVFLSFDRSPIMEIYRKF